MTDEEKNLPGDAQPEPIDPANPPEPIKEQQAKTIREMRAETVPPQEMPEGARELRENETPREMRARREVEDELNKPVEAIEDAVTRLDRDTTPHSPEEVLPHAIANTTDVFGRFTVPLPIYDVVFISLAIFTAIEVVVAELFPTMTLVPIAVLLAIAFVKAIHVVLYYMHLAWDSRLFWGTLLIPFFIALLGLIYLVAIPAQHY
jgi:caa(3)-type oxidase subunit IV